MSTLPVYNVSVPHLAQIPGGMQHGSMVRIKGSMTHTGDRFAINLQTGAALSPCADVNLHLSCRPGEQVIVRNHLQAGVWGSEERYGGCPIHAGQPFEIIVLAQGSCFKVAINGTHFCEFSHRLPMTTTQFVAVSGALSVQSIKLEHDGSGGGSAPPPYTPGYPTQPPHVAVCPPAPPHHTGPHYQPPAGPPPSGFYPGIGAVPYPPPGAPYPPAGVAPYPGGPTYPGGPPFQPPHHQPHHPHHPHQPHHPHHPLHHPHPHMQPIMTPFRPPSHIPTPTPPPPPPPPHYSVHGPNQFDPIQQHQRAFVEAAAIKRQNRNKALAVAAGIGGVGLGALALTSMLVNHSDSDSD